MVFGHRPHRPSFFMSVCLFYFLCLYPKKSPARHTFLFPRFFPRIQENGRNGAVYYYFDRAHIRHFLFVTFYTACMSNVCTSQYSCKTTARWHRNGFIGGIARFPLCRTVERTMTKETERDGYGAQQRERRRHKLLEEEADLRARVL